MTDAEKATLAKRAVEDWDVFHDALLQKARYPKEKFYAFAAAARQYAEAIRNDKFIRRDVVAIVNCLCDEPQQERNRVPGQILYEADRLECLFFSGYDPYFEGDEPRACKQETHPIARGGRRIWVN